MRLYSNQNISLLWQFIIKYLILNTWGNGTYIYMITEDNDVPEEWNIYRIDLGLARKP